MSDVMLIGVLRMPPDCWRDYPLDVKQRHAFYIEAANRIEADADEIERLRKLVTKGLAVVHDFLPNIGRCALQDYQRMVLFCVEAGVIGVTAGTPGGGATDSADEVQR